MHLWWCKWKPAFPPALSNRAEYEEEEEKEEAEEKEERGGRGGRGSSVAGCLLQPRAAPLPSGAAGELCGILVGGDVTAGVGWRRVIYRESQGAIWSQHPLVPAAC